MSNLKQLGLAQSMYTQDYDETFPKGYHRVPDGSDYPWYLAVAPYTRNVSTFRCPSDRNPMKIAQFLSTSLRKQITDFGENYIFADGHAHWMQFRRTLNPQTGGTEGSMWMQHLLRTY